MELQPQQCIGSYRILERLSEGGQGTVYKAERDGRLYVLKVVHKQGPGERARREISLLSRLRHEHIVRFLGSDFWPEVETGHPYLVLEHVEGVTLDVWARHSGASVRERVGTLLKVAKAMREAHRQGVFHRDLKLQNILIRHANGEPVVVDFGAGVFDGAPPLTAPGCLPPSTPEYRSPEAVRFLLGPTEESPLSPESQRLLEAEYHEPSESDDVWALGVVLYWLLTHELPFGTRGEPGLDGRILRRPVQPPNVRHPPVPKAASDLCLRLLEKAPGARLKDDDGLCAALEALLTQGRGPAWEAPLFVPLPWPAPVAAPVPVPVPAPPPAPAPAPAPVLAPPAVAQRLPAPASRLRLLEVLVGVLAAGMLGLGVLLVSHGPVLMPATLERATPSTVASPPVDLTRDAGSGHEIAPPGKSPESESSAAPSQAPTPAPVAPATLSKEEPGVKTEQKPAPSPQRKRLRDLSRKAVAVGAACATLGGCSASAPTVMRPEKPRGAPCPPGAAESMREWGIGEGEDGFGDLDLEEGHHPITVREGPVSVTLLGAMGAHKTGFGRLPTYTQLSGIMVFGGDRAYGRLTQARTPLGETFPVCLQLIGEAELTPDDRMVPNSEFIAGLPFLKTYGHNKVWSNIYFKAVKRFD
jgi:serine/threonine-protein kinase